MLGNKEIMAKNIQYYMNKNDIPAVEICRKLGIKQNTFSNWVNGKIYPRIDKIEKMANFFGVPKSALVEEDGPKKNLELFMKLTEMTSTMSVDQKMKIAMELYDLYQDASPEARKAVEVLLKFEPPQA